jgi:hypothetical protein
MERDYEDIFSQFVTLECNFKFIGAICVAGLDFADEWIGKYLIMMVLLLFGGKRWELCEYF